MGTITNSLATGTATGGAGSTVDPFIALVDPTTAANPPAFPSTIAGCADPTCVFVVTGLLPSSATSPLTPLIPPLAAYDTLGNVRAVDLAAPAFHFTRPADLARGTTGASHSEPHGQYSARRTQHPARRQQCPGRDQDAATASAAAALKRRRRRTAGPARPPEQDRGYSAGHRNPPDPGRGGGADRQQHDCPTSCKPPFDRLGLTVIESESLTNAGSTVVRLKITNGKTPAAAIGSLRNVGMAAIAQPNYVYALDQAGRRPGAGGAGRGRASRATPRSTSSRSSRCWTFTAWSGAPTSRSR